MPIRLAYAITIHKSQGQTLNQAVIDLGSKETQLGITKFWKRLSRSRKFWTLLIRFWGTLRRTKRSIFIPTPASPALMGGQL